MKSRYINVFQKLWQLLQNFGMWLMENTEAALDTALSQLAGKDHSLKAKLAPESTILSGRHTGL